MSGVHRVAKVIAKPTSLGNHLKGPSKPQPIPTIRQATVVSVDTTIGTATIQFPEATSPTLARYFGAPPLSGTIVYVMILNNTPVIVGQCAADDWLGPWGMAWGEIYSEEASGDVSQTTNTETQVVTLGPQLYKAGRKYEIRGLVAVSATATTIRGLVRIENLTDVLRRNILDTSGISAQLTCFSSIYRFLPNSDVTKEFRITMQNVSATGTFIVNGTAPGATGAPPALIQAVDVGPQSI